MEAIQPLESSSKITPQTYLLINVYTIRSHYSGALALINSHAPLASQTPTFDLKAADMKMQ